MRKSINLTLKKWSFTHALYTDPGKKNFNFIMKIIQNYYTNIKNNHTYKTFIIYKIRTRYQRKISTT